MHRLGRVFRWEWIPMAIAMVAIVAIAIGGAHSARSQPDLPLAETSVADRWDSIVQTESASFAYLGSRSCAATACHGAVAADPGAGQIGRNEFLRYWERDPHARAHETLGEPRSIKMFEALGVLQDGQPQEGFKAVYDRCAACHSMQFATPAYTAPLPGQEPRDEVQRAEGVSCEMCHGPASHWIDRHYRQDFATLDADGKGRYGMVETGDLWVRSRMCASCHAGSAEREVSHDFIAAGHPVLKFEMAAYWSQLPPHWKPSRDRAAHTGRGSAAYELQLWLAGQLSTADAALDQLRHRASQSGPDAVWPEFAENDCYACHHDLDAPGNWRQQRGFARSGDDEDARVVAPWNQWNLGLLAELAERDGSPAAQQFADSLDQLRDTMQSGWVPDAAAVREQADEVDQHLARWATTMRLERSSRGTLAGPLAGILQGDQVGSAVDSWDRATQVYLALQALENAATEGRPGSTPRPTGVALRTVRDRLAFPIRKGRAYDSPKQFEGPVAATADEPSSTRDSIQRSLVEIFQDLQPR